MSIRAVILTGSGHADDRWHDFVATSQAIAATLEPLGIECSAHATKAAGFASLDSVDLLIANCGYGLGQGSRAEPGDVWQRSEDALRGYLASGRPVLGVHAASDAFQEVEEWRERLGVRWIQGVSTHPPIGREEVFIQEDAHPIVSGLEDFLLYDEFYCELTVLRPVSVLATHRLGDGPQPLAIASETGGVRAVYDALGHGPESYESADRRRLLQREAAWLLDLAPGADGTVRA
jgi:type 1 glutamine amidotransferase